MLKGYITNLGKYNEGELIGEWIEFPISEDELEEVFERIGINEKYEEFFFSDWDCILDTGLGEHENIEDVNAIAERLTEVINDNEIGKLEAFIEASGYDLIESLCYMDDAVFYPGYTLEEVAEEYVNDCLFTKDTPDIFRRYFDYEAFARDLRFDGYTETVHGVIFIN